MLDLLGRTDQPRISDIPFFGALDEPGTLFDQPYRRLADFAAGALAQVGENEIETLELLLGLVEMVRERLLQIRVRRGLHRL